jgi:hypothetical protein
MKKKLKKFRKEFIKKGKKKSLVLLKILDLMKWNIIFINKVLFRIVLLVL